MLRVLLPTNQTCLATNQVFARCVNTDFCLDWKLRAGVGGGGAVTSLVANKFTTRFENILERITNFFEPQTWFILCHRIHRYLGQMIQALSNLCFLLWLVSVWKRTNNYTTFFGFLFYSSFFLSLQKLYWISLSGLMLWKSLSLLKHFFTQYIACNRI